MINVIFLPGLNYRAEIWDPVIKLLPKDNFNYIKIDLPDYGSFYNSKSLDFTSYPQFLKDKINELQLKEPYILAGHSLGGLVSVNYAADFPKEVKKLILLSTPLRLPASYVPLKYRLPVFIGKRSKKLCTILKKLAKINKNKSDWEIAFLSQTNPYSVACCFTDLFKYDFSPNIKSINIPSLIMYGTKDDYLLGVHGDDLYQFFSHKNIQTFDCDHGIVLKFPELTAKLITKFLDN